MLIVIKCELKVKSNLLVFIFLFFFNPFTPRNNKRLISPPNFNTICSRKVMRIKKQINLGTLFYLSPNSEDRLLNEVWLDASSGPQGFSLRGLI